MGGGEALGRGGLPVRPWARRGVANLPKPDPGPQDGAVPRSLVVRANLVHAADGDPQVQLEFEATGETDVDDIEEHAVGHLPPFMVPRGFSRVVR